MPRESRSLLIDKKFAASSDSRIFSFGQLHILHVSFRHGPQNWNERSLSLGSEATCGRVLHHFSSRTRWNRSRGQVRPEFGPKPKTKMYILVSKQSDSKQNYNPSFLKAKVQRTGWLGQQIADRAKNNGRQQGR